MKAVVVVLLCALVAVSEAGFISPGYGFGGYGYGIGGIGGFGGLGGLGGFGGLYGVKELASEAWVASASAARGIGLVALASWHWPWWHRPRRHRPRRHWHRWCRRRDEEFTHLKS
ncbi:hypothetical protein C0Q70_19104 [Pomacea canaliculata]|uniref:Uncharacterized protein n=1 Tax=Pomacea canaliculata TaxID=400727 RepID=A0A2T7NIE0_POMCA|nr:hypothetical protein C0Q70_19104 [Pomacea canaliculata]